MEDSSSCSIGSSDLESLNMYFNCDNESTKNPKAFFDALNDHHNMEEFTTMSQCEWLQMPSGSEKSNTSTLYNL